MSYNVPIKLNYISNIFPYYALVCKPRAPDVSIALRLMNFMLTLHQAYTNNPEQRSSNTAPQSSDGRCSLRKKVILEEQPEMSREVALNGDGHYSIKDNDRPPSPVSLQRMMPTPISHDRPETTIIPRQNTCENFQVQYSLKSPITIEDVTLSVINTGLESRFQNSSTPETTEQVKPKPKATSTEHSNPIFRILFSMLNCFSRLFLYFFPSEEKKKSESLTESFTKKFEAEITREIIEREPHESARPPGGIYKEDLDIEESSTPTNSTDESSAQDIGQEQSLNSEGIVSQISENSIIQPEVVQNNFVDTPVDIQGNSDLLSNTSQNTNYIELVDTSCAPYMLKRRLHILDIVNKKNKELDRLKQNLVIVKQCIKDYNKSAHIKTKESLNRGYVLMGTEKRILEQMKKLNSEVKRRKDEIVKIESQLRSLQKDYGDTFPEVTDDSMTS